MFRHHLAELRDRVNTIRRALEATDGVRAILANPTFHPWGCMSASVRSAALRLQRSAPDAVAWRALDHATAVTTLYAAYERCVLDLIGEWIKDNIPVIYPN